MVIEEVMIASIVDAIIGYIMGKGADRLSERLRDKLSLDTTKKAFKESLGEAFQHLQKKHPQWVAENFDASFFKLEGVPVLAQFLLINGRADASELAIRWANSLNMRDPARRAFYVRELEPIAADFLKDLTYQLKTKEALHQLHNSQALDRTAEAIEALRQKLGAEKATFGTRRDYLRWLIDRNFYLDPRGTFQTQRQIQVKMEEVYVSLEAQRNETLGAADRLFLQEGLGNSANEIDASRLSPEEVEDRYDQLLARFDYDNTTDRSDNILELAEVVNRNQRVVILGDPGSGKTTLLRYLALKNAQALWNDHLDAGNDLGRARFPILLRVAEYAENGLWKSRSLSDFLPECYRIHECPEHGLTDLLFTELNKGDCLVLLDGLDEIVSADERRGVVQRIEDFVHHYGNRGNRFIITSRIAGYRSAPLGTPFAHYTVKEMNEKQIRNFLERWCQAVEDAQTPELSVQERRNVAKREIESIMRAVQFSPGVRRLAANPLLLRILALIHRTGAQLPQKRIELYKLATDTLARTWRSAQGVPESALITDEYLTPMLSKLAFWLHTHKPTGIATEREVYNVLGEEWARLNDLQWDEDDTIPKIKEEVRKFLVAVREHTGLFVERAPRRYGFMHLTFEEYYAARYLVARSRSRARLIREHLHDPRWEEPILLALGFVGLESPEEAAGLVEAAVLAEGEDAKELQFTASPYEDLLGRDYLFALRCLGDNVPMRSRVQNKLTRRLIDELRSWTGPARFSKYRGTLTERLKFLEGSKIVPVLLECFQEGLKHVPPNLYYLRELPSKIFKQWSQVPPEVYTIILQALHDNDPKVRSQAAINLYILKSAPPKVISALVQRLHDDNKKVRADAMLCLLSLKLPTSRLNAVVFQALKDDDAWVRRQAVVGLAETLRTSPKVIDALVLALHDNYHDIRQWAAYGLGEHRKTSSEIEQDLLQLLLEDDQEVRNVAALALGQLGYLSTEVVLVLLRIPEHDKRLGGSDAAKKLLKQLDFVSSEAFVTLLRALHHGDSQKRQEAAHCLGGVYKATPEILVALVSSLEDEDQHVRQAAAQSLGRLGEATPEVMVGLLRSLHDNNSFVRQEAAQSLGRLGRATPEIIAVLTEALNADNLQERIKAALSLARLEQDTPDICRVLLEGFPQVSDNEERRQIARVLGKVGQGDEPTVKLLIKGLIEPHFYLRFSCVRALVLLGRRFREAQDMILRELVLDINSPEFDKQDGTKRSGHDHAHEALWWLIVGGDISKDED